MSIQNRISPKKIIPIIRKKDSSCGRQASAQKKTRSGLSPQEAQRAARAEMGGIETVKQKVRSATCAFNQRADIVTQSLLLDGKSYRLGEV